MPLSHLPYLGFGNLFERQHSFLLDDEHRGTTRCRISSEDFRLRDAHRLKRTRFISSEVDCVFDRVEEDAEITRCCCARCLYGNRVIQARLFLTFGQQKRQLVCGLFDNRDVRSDEILDFTWQFLSAYSGKEIKCLISLSQLLILDAEKLERRNSNA